MYQASSVSVLKGLGYLQDDPQCLALIVDSTGFQLLLDGRAFDVLHHKVMDAAGNAHVDGLDNVIMAQFGSQMSFPVEPRDQVVFRGQARMEDFDRDQTVHAELPGLVDRAHGTDAQLLQKPIAGDLLVEQGGQFLLGSVALIGRQEARFHQACQQRLRSALRPCGGAAALDFVARDQTSTDQGVGHALFVQLHRTHVRLGGSTGVRFRTGNQGNVPPPFDSGYHGFYESAR